MDSPDSAGDRAPLGWTDFVVRLRFPARDTRTVVFRATDEAEAMQLALDATQTGTWQGWTIVDVVTVAEAIARREGRR